MMDQTAGTQTFVLLEGLPKGYLRGRHVQAPGKTV